MIYQSGTGVTLAVDPSTSDVEVWEGTQSVVLPCQYSKVLEEIVTVTWSRLDLSPSTVHERGEGDILINQNKHYSGRTSMRPDALDSSIFSLILKEPVPSDSGNYICSITDEGSAPCSPLSLWKDRSHIVEEEGERKACFTLTLDRIQFTAQEKHR
uniref:Ig-like domain-containing protein n=1 Tax=Cyprinodon variegatus TaxID=28743 RepID=A0A3Q2CQU4_CYPVA